MNRLVTIITPVYNSSRYIKDCVSSVVDQSYVDWELIIVDDYSTDNSKDIVLELSDKD